jgi:hypothetical protein
MATIDELHEGIKVLEQKVVVMGNQLEELRRKRTEDALSADKRTEIADDIEFIRSNITEHNRRITAMEQQIAAKEQQIAEDKRIAANEQQIAEDRRKEAGQGCLHATFLALKQSNSHAIPFSFVLPHLTFDCHSYSIRSPFGTLVFVCPCFQAQQVGFGWILLCDSTCAILSFVKLGPYVGDVIDAPLTRVVPHFSIRRHFSGNQSRYSTKSWKMLEV